MKINFKSKKQIIIMIIIVLTLSFIFGQSALPIPKSVEKSDGLANTLDSLFEPELVPKPVEPAPDGSGNGDSDNETDSPGESDEQPEDTPAETPPIDNPSTDGGEAPPADDNPSTDGDETPPADEPEKEPEIIYEEKPRPVIDFIIANIRKVAHFVEHGFFGLEIFLFMFFIELDSGKKRKIFPIGIKSLIVALNIGILVGFFDESIQILSGRGPNVNDIWLDISGYATFTAVMFAVFTIVKSVILLVRSIKNRKYII